MLCTVWKSTVYCVRFKKYICIASWRCCATLGSAQSPCKLRHLSHTVTSVQMPSSKRPLLRSPASPGRCLLSVGPSSDSGRTKIWVRERSDNHLMQGWGCMEDFLNCVTWSIWGIRVPGGRCFFAHRRAKKKLPLSVGLDVGSELTAVNSLVFLERKKSVTAS